MYYCYSPSSALLTGSQKTPLTKSPRFKGSSSAPSTPRQTRRSNSSTPGTNSAKRELKKLEDYWTRNSPIEQSSPRLRSKRKVVFDVKDCLGLRKRLVKAANKTPQESPSASNDGKGKSDSGNSVIKQLVCTDDTPCTSGPGNTDSCRNKGKQPAFINAVLYISGKHVREPTGDAKKQTDRNIDNTSCSDESVCEQVAKSESSQKRGTKRTRSGDDKTFEKTVEAKSGKEIDRSDEQKSEALEPVRPKSNVKRRLLPKENIEIGSPFRKVTRHTRSTITKESKSESAGRSLDDIAVENSIERNTVDNIKNSIESFANSLDNIAVNSIDISIGKLAGDNINNSVERNVVNSIDNAIDEINRHEEFNKVENAFVDIGTNHYVTTENIASCDDSDVEDANDDYMPPRKKLRSEITDDELWEGIPLTVSFKRLAPIQKNQHMDYEQLSQGSVTKTEAPLFNYDTNDPENKYTNTKSNDSAGPCSEIIKVPEDVGDIDASQEEVIRIQVTAKAVNEINDQLIAGMKCDNKVIEFRLNKDIGKEIIPYTNADTDTFKTIDNDKEDNTKRNNTSAEKENIDKRANGELDFMKILENKSDEIAEKETIMSPENLMEQSISQILSCAEENKEEINHTNSDLNDFDEQEKAAIVSKTVSTTLGSLFSVEEIKDISESSVDTIYKTPTRHVLGISELNELKDMEDIKHSNESTPLRRSRRISEQEQIKGPNKGLFQSMEVNDADRFNDSDIAVAESVEIFYTESTDNEIEQKVADKEIEGDRNDDNMPDEQSTHFSTKTGQTPLKLFTKSKSKAKLVAPLRIKLKTPLKCILKTTTQSDRKDSKTKSTKVGTKLPTKCKLKIKVKVPTRKKSESVSKFKAEVKDNYEDKESKYEDRKEEKKKKVKSKIRKKEKERFVYFCDKRLTEH